MILTWRLGAGIVERVDVFTVNKRSKTFSRDGSCLIKVMEEISEILGFNSTLTRLTARYFSRSERSRVWGCAWTGLDWTDSCGGLLPRRWWIFEFHESQECLDRLSDYKLSRKLCLCS
jgi:hypothetical protein